jgi:hypothetical protein
MSSTDTTYDEKAGVQNETEIYSQVNFVNDTEHEEPALLPILDLTEEDIKKGKELGIKISGFESCPYITGDEVGAVLAKYVPAHLLTEVQSITEIQYNNTIAIPEVDDSGYIKSAKKVSIEEGKDFLNRALVLGEEEDKSILGVYSPEGLSNDPQILKLVMLNSIVHGIGNGVLHYYFNRLESKEKHIKLESGDWLTNTLLLFGNVSGNIKEEQQFSSRTRNFPEEDLSGLSASAFLTVFFIEKGVEEFGEAFRLKALNPELFNQKGIPEQRQIIDNLWKSTTSPHAE